MDEVTREDRHADPHSADPHSPDPHSSDTGRGVELRIDDVEDPLTHLLLGEIEIEGRMPYSSNATFLVHVVHAGRAHPAIYKPLRGERPLWDFEPGLHRREVAAYLISETLGLGIVPPTVMREGPLGEGSVQWFVVADPSAHYFTIHEAHPELHDQLRSMALLDIISNNTDRKSGHCLYVPGNEIRPDAIWGIDHGLCFAPEFKLRTVIWEFGGEPMPEALLQPVSELCNRVPPDIEELLDDDEIEAIRGRAAWCVETRRFPTDPTGRRYPWPLI